MFCGGDWLYNEPMLEIMGSGCKTIQVGTLDKAVQMGVVRIPEPAMGLVATIYRDLSVLEKAIEMLVQVVGQVHKLDQSFPFHWTDYYQKEMGKGLWRGFLKIDKLVSRETLADLKLLTNRIEHELARPDGTRQINLDPGLLTADNLILATTKNRAHRVYLRNGVFAEVTLWYVRGGFEFFEWTYPDYRSDQIRLLLEKLRKEYLQLIRSGSQSLLERIHSASDNVS